MDDARRYQHAAAVAWPVAVDDLACTVQRAFGGMSSSSYLLDANGRVAFYSMWGQAPPLAAAIDELLAVTVGRLARPLLAPLVQRTTPLRFRRLGRRAAVPN